MTIEAMTRDPSAPSRAALLRTSMDATVQLGLVMLAGLSERIQRCLADAGAKPVAERGPQHLGQGLLRGQSRHEGVGPTAADIDFQSLDPNRQTPEGWVRGQLTPRSRGRRADSR